MLDKTEVADLRGDPLHLHEQVPPNGRRQHDGVFRLTQQSKLGGR